MIKVLHIIKSLGRGGAEMLLSETLSFHDHEKFKFECIYFLPWKDQMVESIASRGVKVHCFPARNNIQILLQANRVANFIRESEIEIIHAHLPWAGVLARIVGRMTGRPVVYTEHNKQERYHVLTRALNLATLNMTTRVVAVSRDVEQSVRIHKRSLSTQVQTILNGVNVAGFEADPGKRLEVRRQLRIPEGAPVIGTIAVFRPQKRLQRWVEVAADIRKQFPLAHFIVVGDGPLKEDVLRKRDELGLADCVHLVGLQQEVRPYLSTFDAFMMTSEFEGLPIALLEAMAAGLPVVTTDAGGIKEVVRDEIEGLVCGVGDTDKLPALAARILSDTNFAGELGRNARKRVELDFSMSRMVAELESVYAELANGTR